MAQKTRMGTGHRVLVCLFLVPAAICLPVFGALAFDTYWGAPHPIYGISALAILAALICAGVGLYHGRALIAWAGVLASLATLAGFFAVFLSGPYFDG